MRADGRFPNSKEVGQASVEYTLLVALVVLAIAGFATQYHASMHGVAKVTTTSLTAATSALPEGPSSSASRSTEVRGWNGERPLPPLSLVDRVINGVHSAVARLFYRAKSTQ
jgi:Flp pilus assembly pilin Flp